MARPRLSRYGFGDSAARSSGGVVVRDLRSQQEALVKLGELADRATIHPYLHNTAKKIIRGCEGKDDSCELDAIYWAVKQGDPEIPALANGGIKYVADPRYADYFISPVDLLLNAERGANGGDCDDHSSLIASLCGTIGWKSGLRAWGPKGSGGFSHVYPVVAFPKRAKRVIHNEQQFGVFDNVYGMDTTVEEATVGWEPPKGNVLTYWLT